MKSLAFRGLAIGAGHEPLEGLEGPLVVKITTGDAEWAGVSADCAEARGRLSCQPFVRPFVRNRKSDRRLEP